MFGKTVGIIGLGMWTSLAAARPLSWEDIRPGMEAAEQSLETLQCSFTVTMQMLLPRKPVMDGDKLRFELVPDRPPPTVDTYVLRASGNKFWRQRTTRKASGDVVSLTAWDGVRTLGWRPADKSAVTKAAAPPESAGRIADPRMFAYYETAAASRLDFLRSLPAGKIVVREITYEDRNVVLVEAVGDTLGQPGYRIWVDPARGFIPVQT